MAVKCLSGASYQFLFIPLFNILQKKNAFRILIFYPLAKWNFAFLIWNENKNENGEESFKNQTLTPKGKPVTDDQSPADVWLL